MNYKNKIHTKQLLNIAFLISKEQYHNDILFNVKNALTYIHPLNCKDIYETLINLNLKGFEQIDLNRKEYLESNLFKTGNIICFPYHYSRNKYLLQYFQILEISKEHTLLHSKTTLFNSYMNKELNMDENYDISRTYEDSYLRNFLNSNEFLDKFPKSIQNKLITKPIFQDGRYLNDRFFLLSKTDITHTYKNLFQNTKDFIRPNVISRREINKNNPYSKHGIKDNRIYYYNEPGDNYLVSFDCDWFLRSNQETKKWFHSNHIDSVQLFSDGCLSPEHTSVLTYLNDLRCVINAINEGTSIDNSISICPAFYISNT